MATGYLLFCVISVTIVGFSLQQIPSIQTLSDPDFTAKFENGVVKVNTSLTLDQLLDKPLIRSALLHPEVTLYAQVAGKIEVVLTDPAQANVHKRLSVSYCSSELASCQQAQECQNCARCLQVETPGGPMAYVHQCLEANTGTTQTTEGTSTASERTTTTAVREYTTNDQEHACKASIASGKMVCGKKNQCKLLCDKGYALTIKEGQNKFLCEEGNWNPNLERALNGGPACVQPQIPQKLLIIYRLAARIENVCRTREGFHGRVREAFIDRLNGSNLCPRFRDPLPLRYAVLCRNEEKHFFVRCDTKELGARSFGVQLTLIVNFVDIFDENLENARSNVTQYRSLLLDFLKSTLKLNISGFGGAELLPSSVSVRQMILDCAPGHGLVGDYCTVCPAGSQHQEGTCRSCEPSYYQEQPGQPVCKKCPIFNNSLRGSYERIQCRLELPVWLILVLASVVLLLIVTAIVSVFVYRRTRERRKSPGKGSKQDSGSENHAFVLGKRPASAI